MKTKAKLLRKPEIAHLLRAAAGVTGQRAFVIIGTGAAIAQLRSAPLDLMGTREVNLYATRVNNADEISGADRLPARYSEQTLVSRAKCPDWPVIWSDER